MFPPPSSSQIPLIMYNQNHHPSSWISLPQTFQHNTLNRVLTCPTGDHHACHFPPQQPSPSPPSPISSHGGLFKRVVDGFQFAYEASSSSTTSPSTDHNLGFQAGSKSVRIHNEMGKMTHQEIADAKAIAASKSHSEAERRRRERINNHLAKLRSLLPNTTKTDKASLLAEVIQHVKELKRQTSIIATQSPVPGEIDELIIDNTLDEKGKIVIKASLCCDDRSDLLPDLIKTLKMLRVRTLKAEMTTLGRRVKNVLVVTGEDNSSGKDNAQMVNHWINAIEEALRAVVEKSDDGNGGSYTSKRQRTNNIRYI